MTGVADDLPPLPPHDLTWCDKCTGSEPGVAYNGYTADQMRAYVESDRARRHEPEQFALDGTPDIQMIQNVADPEGAIQAHWPDEYLAWYKPEQWMGPHRAVCVFIGNKIHALLAALSLKGAGD